MKTLIKCNIENILLVKKIASCDAAHTCYGLSLSWAAFRLG